MSPDSETTDQYEAIAQAREENVDELDVREAEDRLTEIVNDQGFSTYPPSWD